MFKVWVDDERSMPEDYNAWVKSLEDWWDLRRRLDMMGLEIDFVSFDHDLGNGGDAHDIAKEIEQDAYWGDIEPFEWKVHSANPVGAKKIRQALENADRYWPRMSHPLNDLKWLDEMCDLELVNNEEFIDTMKKLATDMQEIELDPDLEQALLDISEGNIDE